MSISAMDLQEVLNISYIKVYPIGDLPAFVVAIARNKSHQWQVLARTTAPIALFAIGRSQVGITIKGDRTVIGVTALLNLCK